jgi:hypothetical protein
MDHRVDHECMHLCYPLQETLVIAGFLIIALQRVPDVVLPGFTDQSSRSARYHSLSA